MRINWLDAFVSFIDLLSEMSAFLRGLGMTTEYVPLFAILLLAGGVIFWLFLIGAVLLGGCRLVMRGVWAVVDLLPAKGDGGSLPHAE
ncbi:membrane protein [Streptomyces phage Zuko]|uniref:Membrane protein n=1 Tax=Streptomyces phage Zuko TaxID=2601695 RepID=A0A5J6D731_9CAUD|nr:membrane protein [Streptomyces phage Zuko]QEQ93617.1 membrane protein [Streptomyces phage Zuko]